MHVMEKLQKLQVNFAYIWDIRIWRFFHCRQAHVVPVAARSIWNHLHVVCCWLKLVSWAPNCISADHSSTNWANSTNRGPHPSCPNSPLALMWRKDARECSVFFKKRTWRHQQGLYCKNHTVQVSYIYMTKKKLKFKLAFWARKS